MKVLGLFVSIFLVLLLSVPAVAGQACPNANAIAHPANQTVTEGSVVILDGTQSNPKDGFTCQWISLSTPAISITNPNSCTASFTAPEVGASGADFKVRLVITETATACTTITDSKTTTISVANVYTNLPPIASATVFPNPATEGAVVNLDGSSSADPNGDSLAYSWTQIGGTTVSMDNSSGAIATFVAPNDAYPVGESLTFRLTVSDGSLSNSVDKIVNITWVDDPPTAAVTCPSDANEGATVFLDGSSSSDPDDGIKTYAWNQLEGVPNADLNGLNLSASGITFSAPHLTSKLNSMRFGLTVTDNNNLQDSAECEILVLDVTPPVFSGIADITVEATGPSGAAVTFSPTATDAVDGDRPVTCSPLSGSIFAIGSATVECTAGDTAGNTATPTFTVKVVDTTPPVLSLPAGVKAEATGPSGAMVSYSATASDLVDGPVTPVCAPASGATFALGSTTVSCSATDAHGNTSSGTFAVTVVDTTPPALNLPADITVTSTAFSSAAVDYNATANDLVDGPVDVSCSPAAGSDFGIGVTVVNCSATDAHRNTASGSFNVDVVYNWTGFFDPIDNQGASSSINFINVAKAGSSIPAKFSLSGDQGMGIMFIGYPKSQAIPCGTGAIEDNIEQTVTAGSSNLTYDATADQYMYVWKTDKTWAGTCRQLHVKLKDGNIYTANFKFK